LTAVEGENLNLKKQQIHANKDCTDDEGHIAKEHVVELANKLI